MVCDYAASVLKTEAAKLSPGGVVELLGAGYDSKLVDATGGHDVLQYSAPPNDATKNQPSP